jgi:hypothetical protein
MAQIVGIFVAAFSPFEANSLDFCSKIFLRAWPMHSSRGVASQLYLGLGGPN